MNLMLLARNEKPAFILRTNSESANVIIVSGRAAHGVERLTSFATRGATLS